MAEGRCRPPVHNSRLGFGALPCRGALPVAWSGAPDLAGRIWVLVSLFAVPLLLWLKPRSAEEPDALLNKKVPCCCCSAVQSRSAPVSPLAGRGGEGWRWKGESTVALDGGGLEVAGGDELCSLAGLGGEGRYEFSIGLASSAFLASVMAGLLLLCSASRRRGGGDGGLVAADLALVGAAWTDHVACSTARCGTLLELRQRLTEIPSVGNFLPRLSMANGASPCSGVMPRASSSSFSGGSSISAGDFPSAPPQVACSPVELLMP